MSRLRTSLLIAASAVAGGVPAAVLAQQVTGTLGSPNATTTISGKQLPAPAPAFGGVIKEDALQSKQWWAPRIVPPQGRAEHPADHDRRRRLRRAEHLRRRHPDADHGPRRGQRIALQPDVLHGAVLADARRAHNRSKSSFGWLRRHLPSRPPVSRATTASLARTTRPSAASCVDNGYATTWFGKDHNTPTYAASQVGPFNQWPTGMGFDYFYGFVGGDANQWGPNLFRNTTQIYPWLGTSRAGTWLPQWPTTRPYWMTRIHQTDPIQPIFLKYVPGAIACAASPDQGMGGQDSCDASLRRRLRKAARAYLREPEEAWRRAPDEKLTPWPSEILTPWDKLTPEAKKLFIRQVEVFAAYVAYNDHEIGRVIKSFEDLGKLDNTLVIYLNGDNGTSAEGGPLGTFNEVAFFNGVDEFPSTCR